MSLNVNHKDQLLGVLADIVSNSSIILETYILQKFLLERTNGMKPPDLQWVVSLTLIN
jgi:hypothetical protein